MKNRLVFIPGLGADARLFYFQQKAFKNSVVLPWIEPKPQESLAAYAKRLLEHSRLKPGCFLVGVSFGGMLALEMARWIKPKTVILVASCRNPTSIPYVLRLLSAMPARSLLGKSLARVFPSATGRFLGGETAEQIDLLVRMYLGTPNDFLNWTMHAIRGWKGHDGGKTRVRQIHGERDHLIPFKNVPADSMVKGGGHLINLTHPDEVNAFIQKNLRG